MASSNETKTKSNHEGHYLPSKERISPERIREIAKATIGQRENPLWQEYRRNRLTASQFGKAIRSIDAFVRRGRDDFLQELRNEVMQRKKFETNEAMQWGIDHEKDAIQEYEKRTGKKVIETGIWIFPDGYLAASPDGIVVDADNPDKYLGIVEVKCPARVKDIIINHDCQWHGHLNYLDKNNQLYPHHAYYHQIQGQLYATGMNWCDFIIWNPSNLLVQRIVSDPEWVARCLTDLQVFYEWDILRPEDRRVAPNSLELNPATEVDLRQLFSHSDKCAKLTQHFLHALSIHLCRWISTNRTDRKRLTKEELILQWNEAKQNICRSCLFKLFKFLWRDSERPYVPCEEIEQMSQNNWKIPEDFIMKAKEYIKFDREIEFAPCLCVKL